MWFGHIYEAATGVDPRTRKGGPIGQGLVATSFSSWFDGTAPHSGNAASASDYPLVPINSGSFRHVGRNPPCFVFAEQLGC